MSFRQLALDSVTRAKAELENNDEHRVRYSALELRLAMEALTYDRARAYKNEIAENEYRTWQPRKLMQVLLELDPSIDSSVGVRIGPSQEDGSANNEPIKMQDMGVDNVLSLTTLKRHYDALGHFLHMPSLQSVESGATLNFSSLKARCEEIVKELEKVLSSRIWNVTLGSFSTLPECGRCGKTVRRRIPRSAESVAAKCFECGAAYTVIDIDGQSVWRPKVEKIDCQTPGCSQQQVIWMDQIKPGTWWTCRGCHQKFELGIGVSKKIEGE